MRCDGKELLWDEACLQVRASIPVTLYSQISECFKCNLSEVRRFEGYGEVVMSTVYATDLLLTPSTTLPATNCSERFEFEQHGVYGVNASGPLLMCSHVYPISPPDDVYKPLWVMSLVFVLTLVFIGIGAAIRQAKVLLRFFRTGSEFRQLHNDLGWPGGGGSLSGSSGRIRAESVSRTPSPTPPDPLGGRHRVKAVDTFRGITVALMIFVNSGGGNYWIFQHSPWNGLTVADLVFPWFVWLMGVSVVMSVRKQLRAERCRFQVFESAIKRTLTLLALGIVLNSQSTVDLSVLRFPGVLQRLALVFLFLAILQISFATPEYVAVGNSCMDRLSDLVSCWRQWLLTAFLIVLHTYVSLRVKYEDCPPGYLGPGGLSEGGKYFNCTGGIASYVDRTVFGQAHLYSRSTQQQIYHTTIPVDPEGLFSTLTCFLTGLLGVQAGQTLLSFYNPYRRLSRWILWALITGLSGGALCGFSWEGGLIPINKNLWSLSYVLVTSSTAFSILTVLYLLVDHSQMWTGAPFIHTGRNALVVYIGSCLTGGLFPFKWIPLVDRTTHGEYLFMSCLATFLWITLSCIMARNRLYLTV